MKRYLINSRLNLTLADQSLVSATNFLIGVILARYLGVEAFGIFTLLWMIVLFVQSLQMALIISPMMTIGPILKELDQANYYRALSTHQIIFSTLTACLLFLSLLILNFTYKDWNLIDYALPLSITLFLSQNQDFIRRVLFIKGRTLSAFALDLLAYGFRLVILLYIFQAGYLSIINTFWAISLSLFISILLGINHLYKPTTDLLVIKDAYSRNWNTSKWLLGSALMQWTSGNYFIISAGVILGPISVGILRAIGNLIGITNIIFLGLENIIPAAASKVLRVSGVLNFRLYLTNILIFGGLAMLGILFGLTLFAEQLIGLLYGTEYSGNQYILIWYCISTMIQFINLPLVFGLRSFENTKPIFISYLVTTMFSVVSAYFLITQFSELGVLYGVVVNNIIMVVISYYYFNKSYLNLAE